MPSYSSTLVLAGATTPRRPPDGEHDLTAFVNHCLMTFEQCQMATEQRRDRRYAYPALLSVTPVDVESMTALAEPLGAIGKQISSKSLGFYHAQVLPYTYFLVSVVGSNGERREQLLWRRRWCRFLGESWYESGGQLLRLAILSDHKNLVKNSTNDL